MSVINQVLNELEERGEHDIHGQSVVRAVLPVRRNFYVHLLAIALGLSIVIVAWVWISIRQLQVVPAELPPGVYPKILAQPEQKIDQAIVVVDQESTISAGSKGMAQGEKFKTASRLSLELSTLPRMSSAEQNAAKSQAGEWGSAPAALESDNARSPGNVMPMKRVSTQQQADAEFRRAADLMQMGRVDDAMAGYQAALQLNPDHGAARQALVALLLEAKRNTDAELVLIEGLRTKPENTAFTMLLARLQVERGALDQATVTLQKSLPFADKQSDYRAFLAALLQRQNRHLDALEQYRIVLQHAPDNGIWLMGYGISLQAEKRNAEAKDAYLHALNTKTLSTELQSFVQNKLKEL